MTTPPIPATPEPNRPAHETTPQEMTALEKADRWILNNCHHACGGDHACIECYPHGDIVIPGFQCAVHAAKARRLRSEPASQLEQARSATASPKEATT